MFAVNTNCLYLYIVIQAKIIKTSKVMATTPKIQTVTFYVDFLPFVVEFMCDARGLRAFENPEIEIYSIDGRPEEMYSDRVIEKIEEEIRFHCFKDVKIEAEFQEEAKGDELRGN